MAARRSALGSLAALATPAGLGLTRPRDRGQYLGIHQPHTFYWKTSYVRRATAPDGAVYAVGSGLYQMKLERFFAVEQVVYLDRDEG